MTYLGSKGFVAEKCDVEHWCRHTLVGRLLGNPRILYGPHNAKSIKGKECSHNEHYKALESLL